MRLGVYRSARTTCTVIHRVKFVYQPFLVSQDVVLFTSLLQLTSIVKNAIQKRSTFPEGCRSAISYNFVGR